jgi:DNA primase catalytic subunit
MTMAMKVVDAGLREDFGFENIAWIYSGRRGVHAWISDESARTLSNEGRSAVASYFQVQSFLVVVVVYIYMELSNPTHSIIHPSTCSGCS